MDDRDVALAWAAGLFDGEGCTYLRHGTRKRDRPEITLSITQCFDPAVLLRFRDAVDLGSVTGPVNESGRGNGPRWNYRSENVSTSLAVLTALWPHLSEPKRAQARRVVASFVEAAEASYQPQALERKRALVRAFLASIQQREGEKDVSCVF